MGLDKARIPFRGRPLAEHVASVLAEVVSEVVLLSRDADDPRFPGWTIVPDRRPGEGPLAGLESALDHAGGRAVFLAACDLPGLTSELIRHVVGSGRALEELLRSPRAEARVPVFEDRLQPVVALYSPACLAEVEAALERGERALYRLLERIHTTPVRLTPELPFYHPTLLHNVNSPSDLQLYERDRQI